MVNMAGPPFERFERFVCDGCQAVALSNQFFGSLLDEGSGVTGLYLQPAGGR